MLRTQRQMVIGDKLYGLSDSNCEPNCPNPGDGKLTNGKAETNISLTQGGQEHYYIDVPAGRRLSVTISGGTGDADLYTRFGSKPTTGSWDCRPYRNGNSETCTVTSTKGGRYFIMLRGYRAANGVSLKASY